MTVPQLHATVPLPEDCLLLICQKLLPGDLCRLACVAKNFTQFASKDALWKWMSLNEKTDKCFKERFKQKAILSFEELKKRYYSVIDNLESNEETIGFKCHFPFNPGLRFEVKLIYSHTSPCEGKVFEEVIMATEFPKQKLFTQSMEATVANNPYGDDVTYYDIAVPTSSGIDQTTLQEMLIYRFNKIEAEDYEDYHESLIDFFSWVAIAALVLTASTMEYDDACDSAKELL